MAASVGVPQLRDPSRLGDSHEDPGRVLATAVGLARDGFRVGGIGWHGADEWLEPIGRAMRLELEAHAFAGPADSGYELLSGLTALRLMPALAVVRPACRRWRGGLNATVNYVMAGLQRRTQYTFGVSPVFARKISERLRLWCWPGWGWRSALLCVRALSGVRDGWKSGHLPGCAGSWYHSPLRSVCWRSAGAVGRQSGCSGAWITMEFVLKLCGMCLRH